MPEEPELLEIFFTASGKALHLSNAFESKCRSLLKFLHFVDQFDPAVDTLASFNLEKALKDTMLGASIKGLGKFPEFTAADIDRLNKGTEARNFIAHEGADLG